MATPSPKWRGFELYVSSTGSSQPCGRSRRSRWRAQADKVLSGCQRSHSQASSTMAAFPEEADEETRRAHREREDLVRERRSILNKIDAILATLGVKGYRNLRSDRREQLAGLRQPDGDPVPQVARIRIERLLDRLKLTLRQIKEVEVTRDAVLKKPAPADEAGRMIRSLVDMRAERPRTRDTSRARDFLTADRQSSGARILCWTRRDAITMSIGPFLSLSKQPRS
jgi:hypothetical protein